MGLKDLGKNAPGAQRLDAMKGVADVASVGLAFVFAIVIGAAAGWWLDQRFGWTPYGFLGGFGLGLAAGVRNMVIVVKKYWNPKK